MDPAKLPHFSRLLGTAREVDPDADFERALDTLIKGLASQDWNESFRSAIMESSRSDRKGLR
ncbi:TetR/AcrR family transcriptional regulator C-terminal domain-containing protein [Nonomuraea sp. NPDC005983]|uniref:TetR/AcrR family transcriptional regulator C-terminal domain-containing protein n=1 Tax=Nonomuraea sp. NPDC005983 TaxID=3155595 RepID=UPI0033AE43DB